MRQPSAFVIYGTVRKRGVSICGSNQVDGDRDGEMDSSGGVSKRSGVAPESHYYNLMGRDIKKPLFFSFFFVLKITGSEYLPELLVSETVSISSLFSKQYPSRNKTKE